MKLFAALAVFILAGVVACSPKPVDDAPAHAAPVVANAADKALILAALAPSIARDLAQPVAFRDAVVKTEGDWAWVTALPTAETGGPVDFARTKYAARAADGDLDGGGTIVALLQYETGAWTVRNFTLGATDVSYLDWPQEYGAPPELMGLGEAPSAP